MAAKGARVHVYGDWDGTGVKRAQQDLSAFGRQVDGFSSTFTRSFAGIGAAVGGLMAAGAIKDFFQSSIQGALEDQKSMVGLAKAIENVGLAGQQAGMERFVAQLAAATGVADDQLRPSLSRLVTVTGDVAASQKLMGEAMNISAGTGKDLDTVTQALAKAANGQMGALTRLGIPLDATIIKNKDLAAAQKIIDARFGGQSAAAAATYSGKMAILADAANEAKEKIGYALLGAVSRITSKIGGTDGAAEAFDGFADSVNGVISKVEILATALVDLKNKFSPIVSVMTWVDERVGGFPNVVAGVLGHNLGFNPQVGQAAMAALQAEADRKQALDDIAAGVGSGMGGHTQGSAGLVAARESAAAAARARAAASAASAAGAQASHAKAVDYTAQAYDKLKTAYDSWYKDGFDGLKGKLDEATAAFSDFKTSVRDSIAGALDFGSAAQEVDENGAKVGKSFIEKLQEQAALAVGFADKVKTLIASGLSRESLSQVIAAGASAGSSIADELIAGGSTAIDTTNSLVTSAQGAADEVGTLSAEKWYGAGVKSAQATVDAFAAEYGPKGKSRAAIMEHMDKLAESMNRNATVTVTTINRVVSQSVPSVARGGIDNDVLTPFALGGVVTGPTRALIGEKGPEAVIPLDRMGQMGGTTINVYVEGSVSSERDLITSIRDGIAQDVRRRGGDPSFLGV